MTRFLICAAPLLIFATPAFAQQAGADAAVAPAAPAPAAAPAVSPAPAAPGATPVALAAETAKPRKICRTFKVTGRRISQSTCYTAAQWAEYDRNGEEAAKKLFNEVGQGAAKNDMKSGSGGALNTNTMFGF